MGFWSDRRRKGQETPDSLRPSASTSYVSSRTLSSVRAPATRAQLEELPGLSGGRFRRRTSIKRFARAEGEELYIKVQVDDGSRLGRLNPLAEHLIIATPDGEMVGDFTMASEGNEPAPLPLPR
jgi:hypothetical protein